MLKRDLSAAHSVRRLTRVVAGLGVCGALLIASGSAQAASAATSSTTCTGIIAFTEITGNLTVPPGGTCRLVGAVVIDGNVSVGKGSDFITRAIGSSVAVIKGNLSTEGADAVEMSTTTVDGNASFDGTSGTGACGNSVSVCLSQNSFGGSVSITNTSPGLVVFWGNVVGHDLTCRGNSEVANLDMPNTVQGQAFGQCVGL
jgi:hypothetical protein